MFAICQFSKKKKHKNTVHQFCAPFFCFIIDQNCHFLEEALVFLLKISTEGRRWRGRLFEGGRFTEGERS